MHIAGKMLRSFESSLDKRLVDNDQVVENWLRSEEPSSQTSLDPLIS